MRWTIAAGLLFALILIPANAVAQDNPILVQINEFNKAYNAKDAEAIALFYGEKGAVLPPRSKAVIGREAIAAHYNTAFGQGVSNLRYKVNEIGQTGPAAAVEIGIATFKVGKQTVTGRSMRLWKKFDGKWLLHRDMYHILSVQ